nr:Chain A, peptide 12530 [Hirudo medicinalis]
KFKKVIWKSFL